MHNQIDYSARILQAHRIRHYATVTRNVIVACVGFALFYAITLLLLQLFPNVLNK